MSVTLLEKQAPTRGGSTPENQAGVARLTRRDAAAAILTAAIALGVYIYTLAPSVTLEDSGELIVAASLFGVPHPPGYPLWTMSGWLLTQLLPFGSFAWRINLLSALYGATACGLLAMLACGSGRWLLAAVFPQLPEDWRERLPFFGGIAAGLALAFSESMWSQAVIAEVYTLNAFFLVAVLYALFRWVVAPGRVGWLLVAVLAYCLGMTNHHTLMLMLPAFLLLVAWIRPGLLPSFLVGFAGLLLSVLAVFTWFSDNGALQIITERAAWLVLLGTAGLSAWLVRRFQWRRFGLGVGIAAVLYAWASLLMGAWFAVETTTGLWLFLLVGLCGGLLATSSLHRGLVVGMLALGWVGLLPYGYLSVASDTNPPMNWGYPQTQRGFYQLIGREQYANGLSRMIIKMADLGGLYQATAQEKDTPGVKVGVPLAIADAVKQYGLSLDENFTTPLCLLALAVIFYFRSLAPPMRGWLVFLLVSFLLLAFAMSVIEPPVSLDAAFLWVTRVFKIQSHVLFVLTIAYGAILLGAYLSTIFKEVPSYAAAGLLLLVMLPLEQNAQANSMRGRWFGFQYGYEMLAGLPRNAVVFGGTDAGRFVPTYMIFGESTQPEDVKTVPGFDRRDLFIITQSQLAHSLYLQSLRDQYGTPPGERQWSAFDRWLGRPEQYPAMWLDLPTQEDEYNATREYAVRTGQVNTGRALEFTGGNRLFFLHAILARMIFEKNKDKHDFFIEMHFPLEWAWEHLEPAGLLLRIAPEPLKTISPEVVARDTAFWARLTPRLLATPGYDMDLPAQRAFSDARAFIAQVYRHREMWPQARAAYAQAFALGPNNLGNVVVPYFRFLLKEESFDDAEVLLATARERDPNSKSVRRLEEILAVRRRLIGETKRLEQLITDAPQDFSMHVDLLAAYAQLERFEDFDALLEKVIVMPDVPRRELIGSLQALAQRGQLAQVARLLKLRLTVEPNDPEMIYQLAATEAQRGEKAAALATLREALAIEPERLVPVIRADHRFDDLRQDPEFLELAPAGKERPLLPVKEHLPANARR